MSEMDDKLIVKLGQRISEQNDTLRMIAAGLQGVESHLRQIAVSSNTAPNYQRASSEYPTFDWSSIGATVLSRDDDGATVVEWNGQVFTRRSPSNKFDAGKTILANNCVILQKLCARRADRKQNRAPATSTSPLARTSFKDTLDDRYYRKNIGPTGIEGQVRERL